MVMIFLNYIIAIVCIFRANITTAAAAGKRLKSGGATGKNAVENLQWTFDENGDVRYTWDAPTSDKLIHHYGISASFEGSVIGNYETADKYYVFKDLNACSSYKFTFESYHSESQKTKLRPVKSNINTLNKAPGKPNILEINLNTNIVNWTASNNNSYCVRGYHLKFFHDQICIKDVLLSQDKTFYELSDINSCSRYIVTLRALGPFANLTSELAEKETDSDWTSYRKKKFITDVQYETLSWSEVRVQWNTTGHSEICIHDFMLSFFNSSGLQIFTTTKYEQKISNLNVCSWYRVTIIPRTIHKEFIGQPIEINVKTKALIPGPVNNLYVVSDKVGKKFLYWLPPEMNRDCVSKYVVHQRGDNSTQLAVTHTKKTHVNVSINVCKHYTFNVTAINDESEVSEPVTVKYFYIPEGRQIDSVNFVEDNDGLIVKWQTSVLEKECFELFHVEICALDHDSPCRSFRPNNYANNSELFVFIPDIVPCVTYKISVSLMDTKGQYAFISEIYHSQVKVFSKPIFKEVVDVSSRAASLKWYLSDLKQNNCPISKSLIECTDVDDNIVTIESSLSRVSEITIGVTNLKPYKKYACTFSVTNTAGMSPKSGNGEFETLEDVPSHPSNLVALNVENNKVNITWAPPTHLNGILNKYQLQVSSTRFLYKLPSWCDVKPDFIWKTIASKQERNIEIANLTAFTEFKISVSAASSIGFGNAVENIISTAPAAPDEVTSPECISTSPLSYRIMWKQPCRANGNLKIFKVSVIGTRDEHPNDIFSYLVLANVSYTDYLYSVKLPKLRPVYKYAVEISGSVENVTAYGKVSTLEFVTPASLPPVPIYETFAEKVKPETIAGQNGTTMKLILTKDMFDDINGKIDYYAIIVGQDISHNNKMESGVTHSLNDWPSVNNWAESSVYDFVFAYQVTPPFWNPFKGKTKNSSIYFVVGENFDCEVPSNSFCNGPLKPETKYSVKVRAFTAAGYQDSPPLKFSTGSETINNARTNYLLVVGLLLLLGFVVCGLYYVRSGEMPLLVQMRHRMNGKSKLTVVPTKNIVLKQFPEFFAKCQDSHVLKIEFNELNEISAKFNLSDNIAKRYDNYRKNRYVNVVPYDETRVRIQGERGDYINASFIEGYKEKKNRYIACQGPLVETFGDFWNMVLQYDVSVIIMLCQNIENKKAVCEKYFPDVNQVSKFDGINVECTMFTSTNLYEERQITVTKDNKKLTVSHVKFLEWPDFGTPSNPETLVDFCCAIRKRYTDSPVVVHCSAGVGRTGTFIACDILLEHLPNNKSVNIFSTVLKLRKQRPNMVQSVTQYMFLHQCVLYALTKLNINSSR